MSLELRSASHLYGEIIIEHAFPKEHQDLIGVLKSAPLPLRAASPLKESGRPLTPKRQMRQLKGNHANMLFPFDQQTFNKELDKTFRERGWTSQPLVGPEFALKGGKSALRGDFVKNGVFVEVEFGNRASFFRDLFKFQIASRSGVGEVAVVIVATDKLARFADQITTFEMVTNLLPYLGVGIQMPLWVIGLQPADWGPIKSRYKEMFDICTAAKIACHPFTDVFQETDVMDLDSGRLDD